jgi:translation initiation factor 4A
MTETKKVSKNMLVEGEGKEEKEEEYEVEEIRSFDEMDLDKNLLRGIYSNGFEKPSVIQSRAIVPVSKGYDVIAQSQSGTGKTGAFSIGMLQRIDINDSSTQALVLAPTRELADQIYKVVSSLASCMNGLKIDLAIGGVRGKYQSRWAVDDNEKHIIIGTPGRVYDNLNRKKVDIHGLKILVLDEADEMLSRGFLDQIKDIFQYIPPEAQIALFSATMPGEILELTSKFMRHPVSILVKKEELTLDGIKQFYIPVEKSHYKLECLYDLFEMISITQAIIYANTKNMASDIYRKLREKGFAVGIITGDMEQEERNLTMKEFRGGKVRVLISTDMLARGIDVQQVSLVINYDLPRNMETYIHRIGRGGRFGRKGVAINLITNEEKKDLDCLEKFYQTFIEQMPESISTFL